MAFEYLMALGAGGDGMFDEEGYDDMEEGEGEGEGEDDG